MDHHPPIINVPPYFTTSIAIARLPQPSDAPLIIDFYQRNEHYLKPWEPKRPEGFITHHFWHNRIKAIQEEFFEDKSICFNLFSADQLQVIGVISFTQILRGIAQSCYLGYAIDANYQGTGIMYTMLKQIIPYVFAQHNIHRIMANHKPDNKRSEKLLQRLGFNREGYAKAYIQIDGHWADHVLNALINPTHIDSNR